MRRDGLFPQKDYLEGMSNQDPSHGLIILTDASCVLKGQSWPDIPTLVWPDGIDEVASDWLRALVVEYDVRSSSAEEYANILRPFLRFCRQRRRVWSSVDDDFLIVWREHLRRGLQISDRRTNSSLKVIFAFYRWAEECKRIRYHVGIYTEAELPPALEGVVFPISAKLTYSKGRHGRVFGKWTTPLTIKDSGPGSARHTPTEEQIRDLHEVAVERVNGERDSLMMSWTEETGLRRVELLRLGKSHMPTADQLSELIERDEPWLVAVARKGGKSKPANVPPDLLVRTLDFIEFERRRIVDRCLGSIVGYREPDAVFLSSTTGMALHPDSVTSIGRRTFKKAGVEQASGHRLRARFAVRVIETLVDAIFNGDMVGPESSWIETILVKASEMMGQSSPESLRPYVTYVLNRRIRTADASKASRLASRLRQLRLQEGTLVRRLGDQADLQSAARLLRSGRRVQAASILRALADRLTAGPGPVAQP